MKAQLLALSILTPFAMVFIYAGISEFKRYKSEGRATYGLVYDAESGTTHVTGIAEDDEGYDLSEFDPSDHNDLEIGTETEDDRA